MNDETQHKHRKYYILALFAVFIAILGFILPEIDTKPLTYLNASNISTFGATANGTLQNITDINNGYYNVSEINAQPFYVTVNFTNITNFSFIEVKAKYFSASGTPSTHVVDLEILCDTDKEYEDLFFLENAAEWRYFTRHFPDSIHFIDSAGNVSLRFNHSANGNVNHRLFIDTVRLIILPQYAQNTVTLTQYFNTTGGGTGSQNLSQVLSVGNVANNQSLENVSNINMSGKLWVGMPAKAAFNDIAITRTNQSGITMGFDVVTVNASGNTRAIFRITAGSTADPNTNTNLPFTAYSDTYAAPFTSIVRAVCFLCLEERLGVATLPATSPNGTLGNISFYVQNRTTSMPGFDGNGNLAARIDGNSSLYLYNLTGTGNAYLCIDANGKVFRGNPGC